MMNNNINESKAIPVTTSLKVAEMFGKQHKSVLKLIRDMEIPHEFKRLNFEFIELFQERCDCKKLKSKHYKISQDGFTVLAMGLSGNDMKGGVQ